MGIAARDEGALLLFSGGETRKDAGPRSEAQSYWAIAESKGWFGEFSATFNISWSMYFGKIYAICESLVALIKFT